MYRSNNKIITNKLDKHILKSFGKDYGWDNDNKIDNLKTQLKSFDYLPSDYLKGRELVMGGVFLCYYTDVNKFLKRLNLKALKYYKTDQQLWDLYTHLLSLRISNLVNKGAK